jgi:hypothetical protein
MSIPRQHLPSALFWITQHYAFSIFISQVGFDVLSAVVMESSVFCNITPWSPLKVLHDVLHGIFFDAEDGDGMFLRK